MKIVLDDNFGLRVLIILVVLFIFTSSLYFSNIFFVLLILVIAAIGCGVEWWYLCRNRNGEQNNLWLLLGMAYIALSSLLALMRLGGAALPEQKADGIIFAGIILCIAIGNMAGYFGDKFIKSPNIFKEKFPDKTWAGLLCAVIAAEISALLYSKFSYFDYVLHSDRVNEYGYKSAIPYEEVIATLIPVVLIITIASQAGGSFMSMLKSRAGVKNSNSFMGQKIVSFLDLLSGYLFIFFVLASLGILGLIVFIFV